MPPLPCAEKDARRVCEFFRSHEMSLAKRSNVHLLTGEPNDDGLKATRGGIAQAIEKYLVREATHRDDLVILFFSGHGDRDEDGNYYWVPTNARRGLMSSGFRQEELGGLLEKMKAENVLVVADACHSGAISGKKDLSIRGLDAREKMVITSCRGGERSAEWKDKEQGVFTYALLEALEGTADTAYGNMDERVTFGELKRFLTDRVPKYARKAGGRQHPRIKVPERWDEVYVTK